MPETKFFVYLLRCSDDSLYRSWTTDLMRHLAAHNAGKEAKYTRSRRPVELVYFEELESKSAAMRREWEIKRLSRAEKLEFILTFNVSKTVKAIDCYNCSKIRDGVDDVSEIIKAQGRTMEDMAQNEYARKEASVF